MRGSGNRRLTTIAEHMPSAHRRYAGWTPARIRSRATAVGANTEILVDVIMRNRPHPEQGFRSCIGILRVAKTYVFGTAGGQPCERAMEIDATSYSCVASSPQEQTRAPRTATGRGRAGDRSPQYPRPAILSLMRHRAAPSHPRPTQASQAARHGVTPTPN